MFGPLFPHLDKGRITFFLTADISLGVVTLKKSNVAYTAVLRFFGHFFTKPVLVFFFTYFWLP